MPDASPPPVRLIVPDLAVLDAALAGSDALSAVLGVAVADGWASFRGALQATRDAVAADPASTAWGARLFVAGVPPELVGWGGYKGPPRAGAVELGYEIAPGRRRRGLAGGAVAALLEEAFAAPAVERVLAHTLPEPGPSPRVLERAGFVRDGDLELPDGGIAWRFVRDRR